MSEENIPLVIWSDNDESSNLTEALSYQQKQIQSYHEKINKLQKRLDDTKSFCDSLWEQLREYER